MKSKRSLFNLNELTQVLTRLRLFSLF